MNAKDLEDRLIGFSVAVIHCISVLKKDLYPAEVIGRQLIPAVISSVLNYGEAQVAESRKDFLHKIKLVLKELSEVSVGLTIIQKAGLGRVREEINVECNELISIFVKSTKTASQNLINNQ